MEACTVPSGMELVLREGAFRSVPAQGFLGPSSVGTHFPFLGATKGDSNRLGVWGSLGQPRPATQKRFLISGVGFFSLWLFKGAPDKFIRIIYVYLYTELQGFLRQVVRSVFLCLFQTLLFYFPPFPFCTSSLSAPEPVSAFLFRSRILTVPLYPPPPPVLTSFPLTRQITCSRCLLPSLPLTTAHPPPPTLVPIDFPEFCGYYRLSSFLRTELGASSDREHTVVFGSALLPSVRLFLVPHLPAKFTVHFSLQLTSIPWCV